MSESKTPTYDALKPKEKAFVDAFIEEKFSVTRAGEVVGFKNPAREGSHLRKKAEVSRAIDERLREGRASADMVRARLEDQAFGSIEDMIEFKEVIVGDEAASVVGLNLHQARRLRKLHLVSKIKERVWYDKLKQAEVKEIEVETYSAQAALISLGKGFGIFDKEEKEKLERALLEEQLKIAVFEREDYERRAKGGPSAQRMENRPRPQGGPGVGPCGLYHQALDIELYPLGPLAQLGAVDPHQHCPICGGEPFSFEVP